LSTNNDCGVDVLSICAAIDEGLAEIVEVLRLIREEMEKQTGQLSEISADIQGLG